MVNIRKPKNAIRLSRPASWWGSTWREALPTGNGTIGAAVYGGAVNDSIMITHADLWWQGNVGVLQDVADKLPQVRKALDSYNYTEAEHILQNGLISKGYRPQLGYPLPICDLKVTHALEKSVRDYSRTLNMENGEISVSFRDGSVKCDRSLFVSRTHDMICYEITKTGNKSITVSLSLDIHDKYNARTPTAISKLPDGINIKYENFFMYYSARSDNGTDFGVVAKVTFYGGSQVVSTKGITIVDTDRILVTIKPYIESSREKEWKDKKTSLSANKLTYDKLIKEHAAVHSKLFLACELDLDAADRDVYCDELLRRAQAGDMPLALLEKMWAYGRFLMVCSSTPKSKPQAPYGIWCGDYKAISSQLTFDSIQHSYSHCLAGNLADYMLSVFGYYESHIDDLKKNASRLYGCRGVFVPNIMAHGTGLLGSVDSASIHYTACAGALCRMYWDYYLYTDDTKFLKTRALPFMRDVALFYEEFLKVKGDGLYESSPSYSPHSTPANFIETDLQIARNASIDFAVARELLHNLITGSQATKTNQSEIAKWSDMLTRIPKVEIADNIVREYLEPKLQDNLSSPSTAVFYPVYPSIDTSPIGDNQEHLKQYINTAKKRLLQSAHNTNSVQLLKYSAILARLHESSLSYDTLNLAIKNMTMSNLIMTHNDWRGMGVGAQDIWATYTTEANSLVSAVLQEMVLQSDNNTIAILPALPQDWVRGSVACMLARNGAEISIDWDYKKGNISLSIKGRKAGVVNIIFPQEVKKIRAIGAEKIDYVTRKVSDLMLPAGKVVTIEMKL